MNKDAQGNLNLLLIDEGAMWSDLLIGQGYKVSQVRSTEQALTTLVEANFDILVIDIKVTKGTFDTELRAIGVDIDCLIVFTENDTSLVVEWLTVGGGAVLANAVSKPDFLNALKRLAKKVSSNKRLQQTYHQLVEEKESLSLVLDSLGDALICTDLAGHVTYLNKTAESLTGWSLQKAKGQAVTAVYQTVNGVGLEKNTSPIQPPVPNGDTRPPKQNMTLTSSNGMQYKIRASSVSIKNFFGQTQGTLFTFKDISMGYQQRQQTKFEQAQVQDLFYWMETMAATLNKKGEVIFANKRSLDVIGVDLSDVQGKKLWECPWFSNDDDLMASIQEDYKQACSHVPVLRDTQINSVYGLLWVEFSLHAVFNEDGELDGLVAEGRDVSARKRIEDENYSALQHVKLYRDQTPLAAIEWNTQLEVMYWNVAAERLFGYKLEDIQGEDWIKKILPKKDHLLAHDIWKQIIEKTGGGLVEQSVITKSGELLLLEWHNSALLDESGSVIGGVSLVIDITHKYKAQEAFIAQANEQQDILNTIIDGIVMFSDSGVMLSFNRGAEVLFGYTAEEAIGQHADLIRLDEDKKKVSLYLQKRIKRKLDAGVADTFEVVAQRKDKTTFPALITVVELPVLADGTRRFISVCKNLTRIRAEQSKLQRAMKMDALGKLVGGIAHDYNNMLGVILGYSELITLKYSAVEGLQAYLDKITEAGERGRNLTKRMLAFSKQESQGAKVVDLCEILREQKDFFEKSVTVQIHIKYVLDSKHWLTRVDPSELEDALLNLTINAKHAMPTGGQLSFTISTLFLSETEADAVGLVSREYLRLSVTDTGSGMEPEIQSKIFDPFYSTKGLNGTGLGLSQVYGCMERIGGVVKVYSQLGHGTEFVLYFPRYIGEATLQGVANQIEAPPQGNGEMILVVDDEAALRQLAEEILSLAGYKVLAARNAQHALDILQENSVDLLLSDIIMPGMDGYQLAQRVSELYPDVKIQLASGFSDNRHVNIEHKEWYQEVLNKPYTANMLINRVHALLA